MCKSEPQSSLGIDVLIQRDPLGLGLITYNTYKEQIYVKDITVIV